MLTLNNFLGKSRQIGWMCLSVLSALVLKGLSLILGLGGGGNFNLTEKG